MKKFFLFMAAIYSFAMSLMATDYNVWITGYHNAVTQVTSDNMDDIFGYGDKQLSFDPSTNTLTYRQVKSQAFVYAISTTIADFTIKTQLAEDPSEAGPLPSINESDNDYAITFADKLTITGNAGFIISAKTAAFNKTTNLYLDNMEEKNGNPLTGNDLFLQVKPVYYNVWINGTQLSNTKPSFGGATYDDSKKELTLRSATLNTIRSTEPVLSIISEQGTHEGATPASYITTSTDSYGIDIPVGTILNISGPCALVVNANVSAINNISGVRLNGLKEKNDKPLSSAQIDLEPFYNIAINGTMLTQTSDYVNNPSNAINYVPTEKVLYLTQTADIKLHNLYIADSGIQMVIEGENAIIATTDNAIEVHHPLSISGTGSLYIEAQKEAITDDIVLGEGLAKVIDTPTKLYIAAPIEEKPMLCKGVFSITADSTAQFYDENLLYSPLLDMYAFESTELKGYWTPYVPWNQDYQQVTVLNQPEDYTLLSQAHWNYIFRLRPNALYLWAAATIEGTNGYVILPDNWIWYEGANFTPNSVQADPKFEANTYTLDEWLTMEAGGALFLPALGYAINNAPSFVNHAVSYWTSTTSGTKHVALNSGATSQDFQLNDDAFACPARMVHVVKAGEDKGDDKQEEGIFNINANTIVTKRIVNGQLVIIRDGKAYDMMGAEL